MKFNAVLHCADGEQIQLNMETDATCPIPGVILIEHNMKAFQLNPQTVGLEGEHHYFSTECLILSSRPTQAEAVYRKTNVSRATVN